MRWTASLPERFEAKISMCPIAGCWIWMGATNPAGYGLIRINDRLTPAHRVAWELYVDEIPEGLFVLHKCDVPCCVNPSHLFVGTHTQNMRDMARKGRHRAATKPELTVRGAKHPMVKLTEENVRQIRALAAGGAKECELARQFSVYYTTINKIVRRTTWRHI